MVISQGLLCPPLNITNVDYHDLKPPEGFFETTQKQLS